MNRFHRERRRDGVDVLAPRHGAPFGVVGMGTATTSRRHFNRTVGVPPDSYHRACRAQLDPNSPG